MEFKKRKRRRLPLFLKLSIPTQSCNYTFILIGINIDKIATNNEWGQKATWNPYHSLLSGWPTKARWLSWIPDFILLHGPNMPPTTHESPSNHGREQSSRNRHMEGQVGGWSGTKKRIVIEGGEGSEEAVFWKSRKETIPRLYKWWTLLLCLLRGTEQLLDIRLSYL